MMSKTMGSEPQLTGDRLQLKELQKVSLNNKHILEDTAMKSQMPIQPMIEKLKIHMIVKTSVSKIMDSDQLITGQVDHLPKDHITINTTLMLKSNTTIMPKSIITRKDIAMKLLTVTTLMT